MANTSPNRSLNSVLFSREQCWKSNTRILPSFSDFVIGIHPEPGIPQVDRWQRHALGRSNSFPILPTISQLGVHPSEHKLDFKALDLGRISPGFKDTPTGVAVRNQLPSLEFTVTAPTSTGPSSIEIETELERERVLVELLDRSDVDAIALTHCISELLDDDVQPAYRQGWFRPDAPDNEFTARLEEKIQGLGRDDLVKEFFTRDDRREAYGERVSVPRRANSTGSEDSSLTDKTDSTQVTKADISSARHRKVEKRRRNRHRGLQMQSDLRCCEITAECGKEHAKAEKEKQVDGHPTKSKGAKVPGKDEQLWTAIYAHEFSGRVVQSEHDGRKKAEKVIWLLLQFIARQQKSGQKFNAWPAGVKPRRFSPANCASWARRKCLQQGLEQLFKEGWTENSTDADSESDYGQSHSSANSQWERQQGVLHKETSVTTTL